jgi:hypothetical protein
MIYRPLPLLVSLVTSTTYSFSLIFSLFLGISFTKKNTCDTLHHFFAFLLTQYHTTIRCMQCDNARKFLTTLRNLFSSQGVFFPLSCLYTSPQNGCAELLIHTNNDIVHTLLFQANLLAPFWVKALHTANNLLSPRPSRVINNRTPHFLLYGTHPTYEHLRTSGSLCFPNLSPNANHKLAPRSIYCVFLGYPHEHKGYH